MAIEKKITEYLRKVAPGNPIRTVIDDLVRANLGAIIVFETPELYSKGLFEGGFKINSKFSAQKLFELCKMDGAIIVSSDLKRILYANVLITPDKNIYSSETGTRHKAAERCAKQAKAFVIVVSERRRKTTLYIENSRYNLRSSDELIRDIIANLEVLEDQRSSFNELVKKLDILELSQLVNAIDVARIIQKSELMIRINEDLKRYIIEIGNEGKIINMRFRELTRNFEKIESDVIRDYSAHTLKRTKNLLEGLSFDDLLNLDSLSELVLKRGSEEQMEPKGYRFLSKLELNNKEVSILVRQYSNLTNILSISEKELENSFRSKASSIKKEIEHLREQILSGKDISE